MGRISIYELSYVEFVELIDASVKKAISEMLQGDIPLFNTHSPPSNSIETYTTKEVCTLLGITPPTLIKYRKQGKIRAKQMGGKNIYLKSEVNKFLKN
ncbi:MAG: DNA-binding protein [Sphingobacteriales bacterium]|nr:MAG: DNA-binding protein [Sphingobacteriales bacterium]